jgi:DNA-binding transcriptional regulator YiaG
MNTTETNFAILSASFKCVSSKFYLNPLRMEKVKLIQLRKTKGMSQQDMAERLYMDVSK